MTCWQCGAQLPPDVGFCRACGAFVRPRNVPANRWGVTSPGTTQTPSGPGVDVTPAQPPSSSVAGSEQIPQFAAGSVPWSVSESATATPTPAGTAAPSTSWPRAAAAWQPTSSTHTGIASSGVDSDSSLGEVLVGVGTGFVLISLLFAWYRVTITPLGVQFFESLERALFSRLFPQVSAGLGGLTGPLTLSVSPLDKAAGGWRWAILVVSAVILLEVLLAVSSGATREPAARWPHTPVLFVLTVANFLLVLAAFVSLPYGGTPAGYLIVTRGVGAYLGLVAALVACGGAVAVLVKSSPGGGRRPPDRRR